MIKVNNGHLKRSGQEPISVEKIPTMQMDELSRAFERLVAEGRNIFDSYTEAEDFSEMGRHKGRLDTTMALIYQVKARIRTLEKEQQRKDSLMGVGE